MPKKLHNALNPKTVAALTVPGTYADGGGLALRVDNRGNRRWIWRGTVDGKAAMRGLGSYPAVSLAEARRAATATALAATASEPEPDRPPVPTFAEAAKLLIDSRRPTWSNPKHVAQWRNTLAAYAHPIIGQKPVDAITNADIMAVLDPIWTEKPETASRVRQRMEAVLDWAAARGHRPPENPAGKHILKALPNVKRLREHHRALPYAAVPATIRRVRLSNARPLTRLCFELLVLTASRSGEVREAQWSEIDWNSRTWTVPAERMKARREHRVPLSDQAVAVLRDAWSLSGPDGYIFPGPRSGGPLSDMGLTQLLRREKVDAVPHGFRSSFRDWAAEQSGASWAVCESALAHSVGSGVEQAYMRSDLLDQRRGLMQGWGDYCAG